MLQSPGTMCTDERAKGVDLGRLRVNEEVVLERGLRQEGVERTTEDIVPGGLGDVHPAAGKGVDVDMVERGLLLRGDDRRIGRGVLANDIQLDLGPVPDLVEDHV